MSSLPVPNLPHLMEADEFWKGLAAGTFSLERCRSCATLVWYPRGFCASCGSEDVAPVTASGRGTVYSFSVVHRAVGEYRGHEPYVVAYVELEEGPRILTNIVTCDPASLAIGATVRIVFEHGTDGSVLYRFAPA